MRFDELTTDDAVLAELGRRLERQRLQRNLSQDRLAFDAHVGRATVQRLERGQSAQTASLVKVLRALELIDGLDYLVPASAALPIAELERQRQRERKRARSPRGKPRQLPSTQPWRWGEEPEAGA